MKPIKIFLFLLVVGTMLFLTALYFPKDGIKISDGFTLKFADGDKLFDKSQLKIKDVEAFLRQYETPIDSTAIKDSLKRAELAYRKAMLRIQWPDNNHQKINGFFESLEGLKNKKAGKKVRVMHYGDSQIEVDRITSYIRNELQKEYGGSGPGLIPAIEGIPSSAVLKESSDNWYRFTLFGQRDSNIFHTRYSPLGSMAMFEYPFVDSLIPDTLIKQAWIRIQPSRIGFNRVKKYTRIALYYGYAPDNCIINAYVNDSLVRFDDLEAFEGFKKIKWNFKTTPKDFKIEILSRKSPEFYAFSLESPTGVIVDNIAMRGSSGTLFKKMYKPQFKQFIKEQPIKLFLLQYGGNTVPYIDSEKEALQYGRWFKAQLEYLQSIKPNAAIIVIGPSDMALKTDNEFATYPYLENVRDVLKNAAFETGCGFWDLYEVMGGKNSMTSWVESNPPLAGKDYVHFTHRGTRKVSELFYKALLKDREEWKYEKVFNNRQLEIDSLEIENE